MVVNAMLLQCSASMQSMEIPCNQCNQDSWDQSILDPHERDERESRERERERIEIHFDAKREIVVVPVTTTTTTTNYYLHTSQWLLHIAQFTTGAFEIKPVGYRSSEIANCLRVVVVPRVDMKKRSVATESDSWLELVATLIHGSAFDTGWCGWLLWLWWWLSSHAQCRVHSWIWIWKYSFSSLDEALLSVLQFSFGIPKVTIHTKTNTTNIKCFVIFKTITHDIPFDLSLIRWWLSDLCSFAFISVQLCVLVLTVYHQWDNMTLNCWSM